ncbi:MAG: PBP1A family penicillin-binding protein, partial [Alphaproteobacteria bacterium]|nr:PBP1A family penicillin-binding protein [Alphaproteobacteria bacterium]
DKRFYTHFGVDLQGLMRAIWVNIRQRRIREGGSTISQQLAKNLFLTPARTLRRKVQETLLALWLERKFTKDQILTIYLNRVYLGAGTYGVDAAARRYFGKPARQVSLYEAAMLAGLLKAPSRFNPGSSPTLAHKRAKLVLARMVNAGFITEKKAALAVKRKHKLAAGLTGAGRYYFADWVLARAVDFIGDTNRDIVIVTTLNSRMQDIGEGQLERYLARFGVKLKVGQGALIALSPNGAVRAMIGGRDYRKSQFNRATQARRQPGSAFKPFVFLAAIEAGIKPTDRFMDAPIRIGRWRPRNYANRYYGRVTLRESLTRSLNSVAVRVSEKVGRGKVIRVARRLGIKSKLRSHPSIALGAAEVTMLELTGAYATLANKGMGVNPYGILEIRERSGRVLYRRRGSGLGRVIAHRHVANMNDVLRSVIVWGTGKNAKINRPAAGKTGTSQDFRDAWFIGYTPDLVVGVWVGNDGSKPMKGVTGGSLPSWIWKGFMVRALKGVPPKRLPGVAWTPGRTSVVR